MSTHRVRTPSKLQALATKVLDLDDCSFRQKLIETAKTESPTATFELVREFAKNAGHTPDGARELAKAARFLAIIMRDYGLEQFLKSTSIQVHNLT